MVEVGSQRDVAGLLRPLNSDEGSLGRRGNGKCQEK